MEKNDLLDFQKDVLLGIITMAFNYITHNGNTQIADTQIAENKLKEDKKDEDEKDEKDGDEKDEKDGDKKDEKDGDKKENKNGENNGENNKDNNGFGVDDNNSVVNNEDPPKLGVSYSIVDAVKEQTGKVTDHVTKMVDLIKERMPPDEQSVNIVLKPKDLMIEKDGDKKENKNGENNGENNKDNNGFGVDDNKSVVNNEDPPKLGVSSSIVDAVKEQTGKVTDYVTKMVDLIKERMTPDEQSVNIVLKPKDPMIENDILDMFEYYVEEKRSFVDSMNEFIKDLMKVNEIFKTNSFTKEKYNENITNQIDNIIIKIINEKGVLKFEKKITNKKEQNTTEQKEPNTAVAEQKEPNKKNRIPPLQNKNNRIPPLQNKKNRIPPNKKPT